MRAKAFRSILQCVILLSLVFPTVNAAASQTSEAVDFRIWTVNAAGEPVYDICYTIVEFSNLGCDENLDGSVLFEGIPPGRHYIVPSVPAGARHGVDPFNTIIDEYNTDVVVEAYGIPGNDTPTEPVVETTTLTLITRDPQTGKTLTGACYELVGYSNVGCDVNSDGQVYFEGIPYSGAYTVRQTTAPGGYVRIDDYVISVMPGPEDNIFGNVVVISQSKSQSQGEKVNITVAMYTTVGSGSVAESGNCVQIFDGQKPVTAKGCDEGILDGRIDFIGVDFDPETMHLEYEFACPWGLSDEEPILLWTGQSSATIYVKLDAVQDCD